MDTLLSVKARVEKVPQVEDGNEEAGPMEAEIALAHDREPGATLLDNADSLATAP